MEISRIPFIDPDDFFFSPDPFNDSDCFDTHKKRRTDQSENYNNYNYNYNNNDDSSFSFEEIFNTCLFIPNNNNNNNTNPEILPDYLIPDTFVHPNVNQTFQTTPNPHKRSADVMLTARDEPSSSPSGGGSSGGSPHSQRRLWVKNRSKAWWEQCDSADYPDEEFKKAFRMGKSTFDMICKELEPVVTKQDTTLRSAIPVRQRVAVCLWRLATGEPLRQVSKRFGLGISTCHKLVLEVCRAIQDVLKPKYLQWPHKQTLKETKRVFESVSGIPSVCGSLYTTHIPIIAPKEKAGMYLNKRHTERNQKTSYSVCLQGVVDSRRLFIDTFIGWPGSMSDDQVLEKSSLFRRANAGAMKGTTLVGNSGYPLTDWVLTPYTNSNNVTWAQHEFNDKVGEIQRFAKEAFMRLKARWSCLQKRTEMKVQDLPSVLMACCILHNICEMHGEELSPALRFELFDDEMVAENGIRSANAKKYRDQIAHILLHYHSAPTAFL